MKIKKEETAIVEHWNFDGKRMTKDFQGERIDWLVSSYLKRIAGDDSGWIVLYQDPEDNRYWEIDYPHGEMQGGGPRTLSFLSDNDVKIKYDLQP